MPRPKSPKKRHKQSLKNRSRNRATRSIIRTSIKQLDAATGSDQAAQKFSGLTSMLDKAAKKHLLHKKTVARMKSRLARKVNAAVSAG